MRTSGMFAGDKQVGVWRSWRDNGIPLEERKYVDGLKDGPTTRWQPSGAKEFEGAYKADEKDGTYSYFDKDNELTKTEEYKNGRLISSKKYPKKPAPAH